MEFLVYGDESGTTGSDRCYSIGLLCVRKDRLTQFNDHVHMLKNKYGIVGELKWSKIKNSSGQSNICIDLLIMVLKSTCCFHSILIQKKLYRNWQTNREAAFYQTYTYLLKNAAARIKHPLEVIIDQKVDKYKKHDEVTGIIANNMLAKIGVGKSILNVSMNNSKEHLGLQVVDILTGAINSGYLKFLDPTLVLSRAKELAFVKMASILGWDKLHYDTYPNKDFNIWHFPGDIRGVPETKAIIPNYTVKYISKDDFG